MLRRQNASVRRALLTLVTLATLTLLATAAPTRAAVPVGCAVHGTVEAVDFGHWGGPVLRGCAVGQSSGFNLLHAAGFSTTGDSHDGDSFICRLGDQAFRAGRQYPTPAEDPCTETPGAGAYWSFWLAAPGQNRWTYAPLGPLADVPRPGEVELWRFGATTISGVHGSGVPPFAPDLLRDAGSSVRIEGRPVLAAEATRVSGASGSPAGLIVGIAVVILLLAGAGLASRRRRQG